MIESTHDFIQGTEEQKDKAIKLYEKNMAWIKLNPQLNDIVQTIEKIDHAQLPTLVFDEHGHGNIIQDNTQLYDDNNKGSEEYYENLTDREMGIQHPPYAHFYFNNKLITNKYTEANLHVAARVHCRRLKFNLHKEINEKDLLNPAFNPNDLFKDSYLGVIASIALGYHFKEFIKRRNPATVTIFDSNIIYLFLSFHCVDYEDIFSHIPTGNFSITISSTISDLYAMFYRTVSYYSMLSLRRASFSFFQPDNIIQQFIVKINDSMSNILTNGFFQDELGMQFNTLFNLKHGARLLSKGHPIIDDVPVFIVGSGPSLKNDIEVIKKNKDKAILIACGSSLQAFIANDLQPDMYVWLEKDQTWYERFRNTSYDLKNTVFLTPITTPPYKGIGRISAPFYIKNTRLARTVFAGQFKDNISFMRSTVAGIWDPQEQYTMPSEAPTVTNTAYGFVNRIGFTETYLFGTDLGTKTKDRHSDFLTFDKKEYDPKLASRESIVPANFGGQVTTMFPYDIALSTFKITTDFLKQSKPYLKLYNCSDGAFIIGATPLLSSEIDLPELKRSKSEILDDIINFYQTIPTNNVLGYWDTLYNKEILAKYKKKLIDFLEDDDLDWHARSLYGAFNDITSTKAILFKYLFSGTLTDLILLAQDAYEKIKEEHQAETLRFIRKILLEEVNTLFDKAELMLETYNAYMIPNSLIHKSIYKKILMYRNYVSGFNFDQSGLEIPPYSEHNKLFSHAALLDEIMIEVNTKVTPKLMSSTYKQYTGISTALNILKNPFRVEYIRIEDKAKLLEIFNKWLESTEDQDLIAKVKEIQQQTTLPTKPLYGDILFANKIFDHIVEKSERDEEFDRHIYAKMRLSLDYERRFELENVDIIYDTSKHKERKEFMQYVVNSMGNKDDIDIFQNLDYYFKKEIVTYNMGEYRQPIESEHYIYDQMAQKITPLLIDYMLKEDKPANNEINLLDEYYNLLAEHMKDESISIYDRSTLLALDLIICPVVEEKVLNKELHEDILDDDFTTALNLTNEVLEASVAVHKFANILNNPIVNIDFTKVKDRVLETIKYHKKIMKNWQTAEKKANKLKEELAQKATEEQEKAQDENKDEKN